MVNAQTTPALPWGDSRRNAATDTTSQRPVSSQSVGGDTHGHGDLVDFPAIGSSIEVKWRIEEGDKVESLWWPAVVQSIEPTPSHDSNAEACAVVRYEAVREFEAETASVVLLPQGRLHHTDNEQAVLRWRRPGQLQSDSEEEEDGDMLLDADDLNQDEQQLERELGVSAEDIMRQQLQSYPMDQQRQLASGARAFVEHFREHLGQLAQAQGGSYTVTENDVQGIFASLKRQ